MIELGFFAVHEGRVAEWEQAYAPLDVRMELVKMKLWLEANPKRRKRQYHRFVVNWLNRAYAVLEFQRFKDRDAVAGSYNPNRQAQPLAPADALWLEDIKRKYPDLVLDKAMPPR